MLWVSLLSLLFVLDYLCAAVFITLWFFRDLWIRRSLECRCVTFDTELVWMLALLMVTYGCKFGIVWCYFGQNVAPWRYGEIKSWWNSKTTDMFEFSSRRNCVNRVRFVNCDPLAIGALSSAFSSHWIVSNVHMVAV